MSDDEIVMFDPRSPETREFLAARGYDRVLDDALAKRREHEISTEALYFPSWESLTDDEKLPYRAAVDECMTAVIQAFEV